MRAAFTGYRPQKLPFGYDEEDARCTALKKRIADCIEELISEGFTEFSSGGALGCDMFAAEAVLAAKKTHPGIRLIMVLPHDGQAEKWSAQQKRRHERLLQGADGVVSISPTYTKACMFQRNRRLVDNADLLVAIYDGQAGGTRMTVEYAKKSGVPVRIVALE
ncbi:MAG: SLOG family protein [Christensenellales bacterium]|jgi:uncharacterized phage-like protein YoqJ